MKRKITLLFLLGFALGFAQNGAPASPYYNGFNWTQTGMVLKNGLTTKISTTHTNTLSYSDAEQSIIVTDLNPTDVTNTNLLLLYGFSSNTCPTNSADDKDHRTRNKAFEDTGTADPCLWNREHTYPKAIGTPNLGTTGPGADAHHLRACDKKRNADRDNDLFFNGTGNSFETGTNWYPGDEWKGDVARMMMYMYLRYPTQCLPVNVGTGATVTTDTNMLQLFLQWNADDPVSQYEDNRNTYHGNTSNTYAQGNRNPFIDNPYLATVIWGGPVAQNRWPTVFLSAEDFTFIENISIYPNPTSNGAFSISSTEQLKAITIYNVNGQIIQEIKNPNTVTTETYNVNNLSTGFYLVQLASENGSVTKKVIVN